MRFISPGPFPKSKSLAQLVVSLYLKYNSNVHGEAIGKFCKSIYGAVALEPPEKYAPFAVLKTIPFNNEAA